MGYYRSLFNLGGYGSSTVIQPGMTRDLTVPYNEDYQGVNYPSPGLITDDQGFLFTSQYPTTPTTWTVTNAPWPDEDYRLASGPNDRLSLALWEPFDPAWPIPQHKWFDIYTQGEIKTWGDGGGFFFRMSADRGSYWRVDRVGLHFVNGDTTDTLVTFPHEKTDGDWFEVNAVGGYVDITVRDLTLGPYGSTYHGPFYDDRNKEATIHGCFDLATATTPTVFLYFDLNFAGSYGYEIGSTVYQVSAAGELTISEGPLSMPPSGLGQEYGRSITVLEGPNGGVLVLLTEVDADWLAPYSSSYRGQLNWVFDVTTTAAIGSQISSVDANIEIYASGITGDEPFYVGSYLHEDDSSERIIWLGPLVPKVLGIETRVAFKS